MPKPVWSTLGNGREETAPYPDIVPAWNNETKGEKWEDQAGHFSKHLESFGPSGPGDGTWKHIYSQIAQPNYPGFDTQPFYCPKGKAVLPNLPWDLYSFMSPASHMSVSCDSLLPTLLFSSKEKPVNSFTIHSRCLLSWGSFPASLKQLVVTLSEFWSHFSKIICALVWCLSPATHFLKADTMSFIFVCFYQFTFPIFIFYISLLGHLLVHSIHSINSEYLLWASWTIFSSGKIAATKTAKVLFSIHDLVHFQKG